MRKLGRPREFKPWHAPCSPIVVADRRTQWESQISETEWRVYREVIEAAHARRIPFAIGGAFAVATYTGSWRDTKDLDVYVLPEHRDRLLELLADLGLEDYYSKTPYDRWWIYRSFRGDIIVDVIWAMANHRAQIDELWMSGPEVELRGCRVRVLPAEAMLWDKLYIMQRDRCDWPDVLNLLYAAGREVRLGIPAAPHRRGFRPAGRRALRFPLDLARPRPPVAASGSGASWAGSARTGKPDDVDQAPRRSAG